MIKNILLAAASCILLFSTANAQKYFSLGPVTSFGHSGVTNGKYFDGVTGAQLRSGFHPSFTAGISAIYAKNPHWGFGGELLYEQQGFTKNIKFKPESLIEPWLLKPTDYDQTKNVGYVRIPLRAYYFFGRYKQKVRPKVYAGPSLGFKVSESNKLEANDDFSESQIKDRGEAAYPNPEFNTFDLGVQVGAGANITLGKAIWLNADINYYQGFLDAMKNTDLFYTSENGTNWNQNLRIQVGVLFGLGRLKK
ncbi:MAG TPA: porin family protein [Edaphocola sp.]|nr:porin family protein [Edaphocola sp.]